MADPSGNQIHQLKRAVTELSVLNDIATAINVTMSVEAVSQIIVDRCARHLEASQGAIFMLGNEETTSPDFKTYVRSAGISKSSLPIHLDEQLKGWMIHHRTALVWHASDKDSRFAGRDFVQRGISSILAVPLLERGRLIGLLVMFNRQADQAFSQADSRFLSIVGAQVAAVLEKARLFEREAEFVKRLQNRRMESLTQLVAGIAHEFNNPVGAIAGSSELLTRAVARIKTAMERSDGHPTPKAPDLEETMKVLEDAARVVESGSSRVAAIVSRLKSFARLDQSELQSVEIHPLLEDSLAMLATRIDKRIEVRKEYAELPPVTCYPAALNQVFFHVLLNAVEAIPDEGYICITTSSEGELVRVIIRDSGAGIDGSHLSRVFDPGFTTKGVRVGTGLGLPICDQIIRTHRGSIRVDSTRGEGTSVILEIPVTQRDPETRKT
ncbi:MAG: HAMP domain-containing histidine kinase [Candidatus Zixiibacteriota bacterium]|nr:MAG: HAMP domain-containing histidine kinase [candidate division Zixibacteria bacterium]